MRLLGAAFVQRFAGRLLNIHPSLLPRHKGLHTHQRALEAGDAEHGASVHFVTAELDGGPVIAQARVPVRPGDDADTLAARVLQVEHPLLLEVLRWAAAGRLHMRDGLAWRDGQPLYTPPRLQFAHD
jgi:phosphoribosylglycinamide formyltransferase-1